MQGEFPEHLHMAMSAADQDKVASGDRGSGSHDHTLIYLGAHGAGLGVPYLG
jgi:hypothetical protein